MNSLAFLGPLQTHELLVILFLVLLLFGAKKLPELARGIGQAVKEFERTRHGLQREIAKDEETPAAPVKEAPDKQEHKVS